MQNGSRSLIDSTAYGRRWATEFEKTAKSLGLNVLSDDATNAKAINFRAFLTKIKAENLDAIMYGGMDATAGPFTKQAMQLGLRAKILGGDGLCTEKLANLAGDAIDNIVSSAGSLPRAKNASGACIRCQVSKTPWRTGCNVAVFIRCGLRYS